MSNSIRFYHGMGDVINIAHVTALYRKYDILLEFETWADKRFLIDDAGGITVPKAKTSYHYPHPDPVEPHMGYFQNVNQLEAKLFDDIADYNKVGNVISRHPFPNIGNAKSLWKELCEIKLEIDIDKEIQKKVSQAVRDLPKPLILIHPQGVNLTHLKNLDRHEQYLLIHHLLDKTPGTIILLDWDNRVQKVENYRVRHLEMDLWKMDVKELLHLINISDLTIGIDSGPLNLCNLTNTPTLGIWPRHHPCFFVLPKPHMLHLVNRDFDKHDRTTRIGFNTIVDDVNGKNISDVACQLLSKPKYGLNLTYDVALQHFIFKTRKHDLAVSNYADRNKTFHLCIDYLKNIDNPTIVSTGCIRSWDDWSAGYSDFLFGLYLYRANKGKLTSVDLDHTNVKFARNVTKEFGERVEIVESDSLEFLKFYKGKKIDLFYSDSLDTTEPGYAEHCLAEVEWVLPHMAKDGWIMMDDTVWNSGKWTGKGEKAVPYLLSKKWEIKYSGYQTILAPGLDYVPIKKLKI